MKYRLNSVIDVPFAVNVVTNMNGANEYRRMRLQPGELYEADETDQPLIQSLVNATTTQSYTPELEQALIKANAIYEVVRCRSCGGKVKKLKFCVIEVVEE